MAEGGREGRGGVYLLLPPTGALWLPDHPAFYPQTFQRFASRACFPGEKSSHLFSIMWHCVEWLECCRGAFPPTSALIFKPIPVVSSSLSVSWGAPSSWEWGSGCWWIPQGSGKSWRPTRYSSPESTSSWGWAGCSSCSASWAAAEPSARTSVCSCLWVH